MVGLVVSSVVFGNCVVVSKPAVDFVDSGWTTEGDVVGWETISLVVGVLALFVVFGTSVVVSKTVFDAVVCTPSTEGKTVGVPMPFVVIGNWLVFSETAVGVVVSNSFTDVDEGIVGQLETSVVCGNCVVDFSSFWTWFGVKDSDLMRLGFSRRLEPKVRVGIVQYKII